MLVCVCVRVCMRVSVYRCIGVWVFVCMSSKLFNNRCDDTTQVTARFNTKCRFNSQNFLFETLIVDTCEKSISKMFSITR